MTNRERNEIIMRLASDPDLLKAFLETIDTVEHSPRVPDEEDGMYVYVMERHTSDGALYHHPLVNTKDMYALMPTDNPDDYGMVADKDLLTLQTKSDRYLSALRAMTGESPVIIKIPLDVYNQLDEKLHDINKNIFDGINKAMEAIGGIGHMRGNEAALAMTKTDLMMSVLKRLHSTVSGACLTADLKLSEPQEYVEDIVPEDEEGCDWDCEDGCDGCPYTEECEDYII